MERTHFRCYRRTKVDGAHPQTGRVAPALSTLHSIATEDGRADSFEPQARHYNLERGDMSPLRKRGHVRAVQDVRLASTLAPPKIGEISG